MSENASDDLPIWVRTAIEFLLCRAVAERRDPDVLHALCQCGIDVADPESLRLVGSTRGVFKDGRFIETPDGSPAVLIPLVNLWREVDDVAICDLPGRNIVALQRRGWCLGMDQLAFSGAFGGALRVFEDYRGWLRQGGRGIVILDYRAALIGFRENDVERLSVGSVREGLALKGRLERALSKLMPGIFIATADEARAEGTAAA